MKAKIGPKLQAAIDAGIAHIRQDEYVGVASDGVEVLLGCVGFDEQNIENYLTVNPTPDTW